MDSDNLTEIPLEDDAEEERKRPGVERIYRNDQIVVLWEPRLCTHTGHCFRGLRHVFKPMDRPWVDVDAASPDEIAATVMNCPTGALKFKRLDGGPQEEVPEETTIKEQLNGPLYVRGRLKIHRQDGSVREESRVALCRCGGSANKPFCDGTHRQNGFRTAPLSKPV